MPSISSSLFILGLIVASAVAEETTISSVQSTASQGLNSDLNAASKSSDTISTISSTSINLDITGTNSNTSINMDITDTNSSIEPSTTKQRDGGKGSDVTPPRTTVSVTTQKPIVPSKNTPATYTDKNKHTTARQPQKGDTTGIIILVVIIVVAVVFAIACYFTRKRGRRYSVDFTSRADEANIPLSTVEPDLTVDTVSQNGLQTFESTEITTKESQEPEANPEVQEEQKAEAAAPAPSPDSSEDKPKEAVVVEESPPPAPVEEKTDDEGIVSNKTSVESLKEPNDNNSNNADLTATELKLGNIFWDVPLDCPV
ncbi:uncharacterized protein C11orf24 [Mastacembelus armatus]|uniref:uncharacterized protein C11orf24 n=1 Tax=Mastacembelus armatus TaxID=205130 RepID=UPI000E45CBD5|nr:uncharacterized protein C11orf24-like [Mastacembelus armatus]